MDIIIENPIPQQAIPNEGIAATIYINVQRYRVCEYEETLPTGPHIYGCF